MLAIAPAAYAEVSTKVCLTDGKTPLELTDPCIPLVYRPIMVGTHLTIIVSSDSSDIWSGGELTIWDANQNYGILSGGLKLPAAGDMASVDSVQQFEGVHDANGFVFLGGYDPSAGDWFIVDYNAIGLGTCSVIFYNWDNWDFDWDNPSYEMSFTHVRTRDFNDDGIVDFSDFAKLGWNWQRTDCGEPGNCSGTDLDTDGDVDYIDLALFADFWLETTR